MILEKYNPDFHYRPLDVFTLNALLYLAYDKHWEIQEATPLNFVPLMLGNRHKFAIPREYKFEIFGKNAYPSFTDTGLDIETIDLQHIGFNGTYFIHWRVGWRPAQKTLVVGLDRNDEYVYIDSRPGLSK